MEDETISSASAVVSEASADTSVLRLMVHLKENQIQYMIGILVAYQLGILDKLWTYGAGVCV